MKLYEAKGGQFYGTQADAKSAVGKGNFTEVDVPTDKAGLISYLNQRANAYDDLRPTRNPRLESIISQTVDDLVVPVDAPKPLGEVAPLWEPVDANPTVASRAQLNIRVEDEIAKADYPNAVRLAMHATSRVGEHLKEMADKANASKLADMLS